MSKVYKHPIFDSPSPFFKKNPPLIDYVYDVKWPPTHPALFGTVDESGQFGLWNSTVK